jgi:DNA-binding MarR family transcriptional regulator
VTDLVRRLQLAQSTVTELVGRAEEAGLIEREGSRTDARVAHLRLTPEGERRLALVFRAHDGERRRLLELLHDLDDGPAPESKRSASQMEG